MQNVSLKPFFSFYGGKWRAAKRYPNPRYKTIIEPFAGSAGFALRYADKSVILVEKDPVIADLWKYLVQAMPDDIRALPLLGPYDDLRLMDLCPEEKSLIGFWLNKGCSRPANMPSAWMRQGIRPNSFWSETIRERVATQVDKIKHWIVVHGDYDEAPYMEATYFVDPPYQAEGKHYFVGNEQINYNSLGEWCRGLKGQVIVCENEQADWLPFTPWIEAKSTPGKYRTSRSYEAIWYKQE